MLISPSQTLPAALCFRSSWSRYLNASNPPWKELAHSCFLNQKHRRKTRIIQRSRSSAHAILTTYYFLKDSSYPSYRLTETYYSPHDHHLITLHPLRIVGQNKTHLSTHILSRTKLVLLRKLSGVKFANIAHRSHIFNVMSHCSLPRFSYDPRRG